MCANIAGEVYPKCTARPKSSSKVRGVTDFHPILADDRRMRCRGPRDERHVTLSSKGAERHK
eukprot:3516367-Pyramimonas_sp.AAC.1